jgi:diguanylate cyclase (GGDEF)-like protein
MLFDEVAMSGDRTSAETLREAEVSVAGRLLTPVGPPGVHASLKDASDAVLRALSQAVQLPVALLSRADAEWRFEGEALPAATPAAARPGTFEPGAPGEQWTGIDLGVVNDREWIFIVPGTAERWGAVPWLERFVKQARGSLEQGLEMEDAVYLARLSRRSFAFSRRLTRRLPGSPSLYRLILRTLASQVGARTGCLAVPSGEQGNRLRIVATVGYPHAIVEHVRVSPGEGILGRVFDSRQALRGTANPRRPRHATDSYLALPIATGRNCLAVVALTDRADGHAFDERDLTAVRALSAPAALALARDAMFGDIDALTRAATVDSLTGLFNRRYLESRLEAEVQRVRRHGLDLALLMADIDDFKRINDSLGHQEGDRVLKEVADLLRGGVRIFDVCARFGGEEFAILMPSASAEIAVQVAERIRRRVEGRSRQDATRVTLSVGVAVLEASDSIEALVGAADRALIAAKRQGKNQVQIERRKPHDGR